ncbi:MAG: DUF4265 domain-containing protein [Bacteroidota bacterium]
MEETKDQVAVVFKYHSPVLDEPVEEELWAKPIDASAGSYELISIPFYGLPLATADHFEAQVNAEDGRLTYQNTLRNSGNSVVVVALVQDDSDHTPIREKLSALGCRSEILNAHYFVAEVPKTVFYGPVRDLLNDYEDQDVAEFAESRLSAKHQSDLRRHK